MATSLFGQIGAFNGNNEMWTLYAERLDEFFASNDINDEVKKKSMLLTVIGADTYAVLRSLVSPIKPTNKTYTELVQVLSQHFNPTPSEIVERYKFNSRNRREGESISIYISELRKMSEFCNYEATLDTMLRDRLVCGCQNDALQSRLLAESKLTLTKAISIAQTMELAAKNVIDIKSQNNVDTTEKVNAVSIVSRQRKAGRYNSHQQSQHSWKNRHTSNTQECTRCKDTSHTASKCPYINESCYNCGKEGHLARACRQPKKERQSSGAHRVTNEETSYHDEYDVFHITTVPLSIDSKGVYHATVKKSKRDIPSPYKITCSINGNTTEMEVDTGSAFTLMPSTRSGNFREKDIKPFNVRLTSLSGQGIEVVGIVSTKVRFKGKEEWLPLVIYKGQGPILCGRTWISSRLPIWKEGVMPQVTNTIAHVSHQSKLEEVLAKHTKLFSPGLGHLRGVKVHLHRKPEAKAKFYKARSIPYALKDKVEEEIKRLEQLGIISSIPFAESAAPIVPVMKKNKTVRICGDFKVTSNQVIDREHYPLPRTEDVFAKLTGCTVFSRIDLRDAYCQLELDEESKDLVVINTTKGLFKYNRLPFGISSSAAIFQKHMEILLSEHIGVTPFQDDVVLGGASNEDHLQRLDKLLYTLENAGLKLRKEKCLFLQSSIDFLGHHLDGQGLHPQATKMTAIMDAPEPSNVEELRSFIGLINYYSKFIPNHATHLSPLYALLVKTSAWNWGKKQQKAFLQAKNLLANSKLLVHFDQKKEILLACDASPVGIGAVISHNADGVEQPIAFASRTLSAAEKNYSQMEREALAIVYGVTKFRDYLLGRRFKLITDHQPLIILLSEKKPIPQMASARLQRWALTLSAYDYAIEYKKGSLNSNADALSRLPLEMQHVDTPLPLEYVFLIQTLDDSPVNVKQLELATTHDTVLATIRRQVVQGWPPKQKITDEILPYYQRRDELATMKQLLMIGQKVIIPKSLRSIMMENLHSTHQGIVKMKSIARSIFWWPGINKDIEDRVAGCTICQEQAAEPKRCYSSWPTPKSPWQRVHMDFAGPIEGKLLLIIVDAFSKWIEVDIVNTASTQNVIRSLQNHMARFGIMNTLVSDNATCFTSTEFANFTKINGIHHLTSAPYHPESNGQAERTVRTIKESLKKLSADAVAEVNTLTTNVLESGHGTLEQRIVRILMQYRRTPLTTGKSPAELMLGRNITTRLDLCHPSNQENITKGAETHCHKKEDLVHVRNYARGPKWIPGVIKGFIGTNMYEVVAEGRSHRRHENQIRSRISKEKREEFNSPSHHKVEKQIQDPIAFYPCEDTAVDIADETNVSNPICENHIPLISTLNGNATPAPFNDNAVVSAENNPDPVHAPNSRPEIVGLDIQEPEVSNKPNHDITRADHQRKVMEPQHNKPQRKSTRTHKPVERLGL